MQRTQFKQKPCKYCEGTDHTSLMCFHKPRRAMRLKSEKSLSKEQVVKKLWYELNPPSPRGIWYCYLQITATCWYKLTSSTITLEHVKSRARYPELKYEVTNLRAACSPCNRRKGSLDLEEIPEYWSGIYRHYQLNLLEEDRGLLLKSDHSPAL